MHAGWFFIVKHKLGYRLRTEIFEIQTRRKWAVQFESEWDHKADALFRISISQPKTWIWLVSIFKLMKPISPHLKADPKALERIEKVYRFRIHEFSHIEASKQPFLTLYHLFKDLYCFLKMIRWTIPYVENTPPKLNDLSRSGYWISGGNPKSAFGRKSESDQNGTRKHVSSTFPAHFSHPVS